MSSFFQQKAALLSVSYSATADTDVKFGWSQPVVPNRKKEQKAFLKEGLLIINYYKKLRKAQLQGTAQS